MTPFFPNHDPKSSIPDDELKILAYWQQDQTFKRTLEERSEKFSYKFFDGPPFATGTPHYGHILAGTIKDAIPRYWTMKGYRVDRKWGWDCHGVPVEFQVEKENKIGGKPGIEKMGVGKFNELCRSVVLRCADQWKDTVARMGRFVDFENDYKTMDPEFMESVWWVFGELYKKGLIYEGEKVVAYSPKLGSPLSNFEANLNYSDIDDPAVTVRFQVLDGETQFLKHANTKSEISTYKQLIKSPRLGEENIFCFVYKQKKTVLAALELEILAEENLVRITKLNFKDAETEKSIKDNLYQNITSWAFDHKKFDRVEGAFGDKPSWNKETHAEEKELKPSLKANYFLAWTTTPWTLPSNVALGFGRETEYSLVEREDANYWVATALITKNFGEDVKILKTEIGKNLAGMTYKPLFNFFTDLAPKQKRFVTIHDEGDYISTESGTGIVHFAPSFGLEDAELCDKWDIAGVNPIDENGYFDFTEMETFALETPPTLHGKYFRADPEVNGSKENNANEWVIEQLKDQGDLFKRDQIRHSYPHCWRTDCALMYRGVKTWFVNIKKIKQTMLDQNQKINWLPEHLKDGRFGNLLESAPDWAISRNRYWGCPIPAWKCNITEQVQVVTSREQLEALSGKKVTDIHKHFVDDLTWASPFAEGGVMQRVPEVLDCWFESGAMPYGSEHYPFVNKSEDKNISLMQAQTTPLPDSIELKNKFWVIRHGESENNVAEKYNSDLSDKDRYGLTERGKTQVQKNTLNQPIDLVISSPFRRCRETAEILAQKFESELLIDPSLREIDLGNFDKGGHQCFKEHDPRFPTGETGESLVNCQRRMVETLLRVNQKYKGKNIILVSHGGPLSALLQWVDRRPLAWPGNNDTYDGIPPNGVLSPLEIFNPKQLKNFYSVIRHSESLKNYRGIENSDPVMSEQYPLTENGKKVVEAEAKKFENFDIIVTSPLFRSKQTAEIFAKRFGKKITVDNRLNDINLGIFDHKHRSEVLAYDEKHDTVLKPFPEGESRLEVRERLRLLLAEYETRYTGKNILLVTHGCPTEVLVDYFLGRTLQSWKNYVPKGKVFDLQSETLLPTIEAKAQKKILEGIKEALVLSDKKKVSDFLKTIWKNEFSLVNKKTVGLKTERLKMFYVEEDGQILAAVDFYESEPSIWKICRLAVIDERRNQKIGSHLFSVVMGYLQQKRASRVFLEAEVGTVSFYENFGFEKISGRKLHPDNPIIAYYDMLLSFEESPTSKEVYFQSADFIAEGLDQTRGWFYTLHVLGCALFGKNIYKNVITNGIVLAEDGQKMSKSKKNYPDPNLVFDKYGADAMRFYLLSSPVVRGENFRFTERGVEEVLKSIILPLKSAYNFLSTYATIDEWEPTTFMWARHGEGTHNVDSIYSGNPETQHVLTALGRKQVQQGAQKLLCPDVIISSPFIRTQETAKILQTALVEKFGTKVPTEILLDQRVQEPFFGELEGKPLIPAFKRLANKTTENIESIALRVDSFVTEMSQKYRGKKILVASHGSPIRHAECASARMYNIWDAIRVPYCPTGGNRILFAEPITENVLDQWILSELQTLVGLYHDHFEAYDLEGALKHIAPFIDKLNNWYLRRSRRRFWAEGLDDDKRSGYETLHHVLFILSKLLAPICPFFAEKLYQDLGGVESVHLAYMPYEKSSFIRSDLEEQIGLIREIVGLAAGIRARAKIKLRQPLAKLRFSVTSDIELDLEVIKAEANVKEVEILTEKALSTFAQKIIRVNARLVGKKFGKKVQEIIQKGKAGDFVIHEDGSVTVAGEILNQDEYEIGFITEEGVEAEATTRSVVLLDTVLTKDLETEGLSRELIRAIQDLRKKSGFDIADRIVVTYESLDTRISAAFDQFLDKISQEVLATTIQAGHTSEVFIIDGISVGIQLEIQ